MNKISELKNIRTPQAWKERLHEEINKGEGIVISCYKKIPVSLAVVIILAVLLAGTALAYALTGGAFFAKIFMQKAETDSADYSYMDVSQLSEIEGSTIGTVVDNDELRIDVTDVLSSGSNAMVALCVTAKQMDSVLLGTDGEEGPLDNYRFDSEDGTLFENMESAKIRYIYSDEDDSLAENQFYLVLMVTSLDEFEAGSYTVELSLFGYYDLMTATGGTVSITTVYEGPWTIELYLSGDTDHSRTVFLNRSIR